MFNGDQWFTEKRKNENCLNGISADCVIYRIFSFERFLELLEENKNTLVKPRKWDDPFENFLFSAKAIDQNGQQIGLESIRESYFGQCWSFHDENDAMWRIYARNKDGIKVKTTVGKLFNEFYSAITGPELKCYIGKVEYKDEEEIRQFLGNDGEVHDHIFDSTGIKSAKTLLFKRNAFEHENEVRLIYVTTDDSEKALDVFKYKINQNSLFEEVVLDPRLDCATYEQYKKKICEAGYSSSIIQSTLYTVPNLTIRINI